MLPSQNEEWGFYGTWQRFHQEHKDRLHPLPDARSMWNKVFSHLMLQAPEWGNRNIRTLLDSTHGRHNADWIATLVIDGMGVTEAMELCEFTR